MADFREFQDGELIQGTRYRVVQLVGVGGMGSVYEVEHIELGKRFVLKALLRELARREDLVARMRNEWRSLARLQHPNIVNVTDAGSSASGVPFYVMERLDGETLGARLKRVRRLAVPDAIRVAVAVLDGLSAAHDIGVVHRDVKPPNIFLLRDGSVKLLDFGIAKIADASSVITARGIAVGTPRYMSPEQARGESVDGRSDIYASGLILFEMLTGAGPFDDARDANELLLAHLARLAPRVSSVALGIAPELDEIVATMLAKDHRARPPRAATVAAALRAFLSERALPPASDAPTGFAAYSAETAARPVEPSPQRELETRPDSPARRTTLLMRDDTTTAQVTLTLDTAELAHSPQKTLIDAPVFGVSTTQMGAAQTGTTEVGISTAPLGLGALAPAVSQEGAVERVERTEILTGVNLPLQEPGPTHTSVPFVDAPQNLTPPPVVESRAAARPARAERTLLLGALVAGAITLAGGVGLFVLSRPAHVAGPSTASATALPARVEPALAEPARAEPVEPQPLAVAVPEPSAATLAASTPSIAAAATPAEAPVAHAAPAPRPRASAVPAATAGPFLSVATQKKVPPASSNQANAAQKQPERKFVLPASGL